MLPSILQINSMKASAVESGGEPDADNFKGFIGTNVSRLGRLGIWILLFISFNNLGAQ